MQTSFPCSAFSDAESLIDQMPAWGSEFDRTFANHAPMVLTALARIGGTPQQMHRFFDYYNGYKKLRPFGIAGEPLDDATWLSALGKREREPDLRIYFTGKLSELGIEGALHHFLPILAPGIAASAFHALMRTAYGVLRKSEMDVAVALGYWRQPTLPCQRLAVPHPSRAIRRKCWRARRG